MYLCMCMHGCVFPFLSVYVYEYVYIPMYMYESVYVYACLCIPLCVCMHIYATRNIVAHGVQKSVIVTLKLVLHTAMNHQMWVLETELRSVKD